MVRRTQRDWPPEGCIRNNQPNGRTLMLIWLPSMCVGFTGVLVTAILLAADWYIWDPRYWISHRCVPKRGPVPGGRQQEYPSAERLCS